MAHGNMINILFPKNKAQNTYKLLDYTTCLITIKYEIDQKTITTSNSNSNHNEKKKFSQKSGQ